MICVSELRALGMWDLPGRRVQAIPVFGSLLLAFVVPGISTHLCEGVPRRASPRGAASLHGQTGTGAWSGKIQTGAEREVRGQGETAQHSVLLEGWCGNVVRERRLLLWASVMEQTSLRRP